MFEQLKTEYDTWVKGKYLKVARGIDPITNVSLRCFRSTPARDHYHSTRWYGKAGDELGDKSYGYRQGDFKGSC